MFYFNLEHPLVGGYAPEKLALRRAISMGFDRQTAIAQLQNGQAITANQPVPPPLYGHDPKYVAPYGYDPRAARALLDRFGYKDRDGDGFRELPDGKPLTLVLASTTDNAARARDELWKRNMDALGIRITFLKNKWPELNRMSEAGQLMMWGFGWTSNVPEGIDFYSYFYSRNIGTSNDARMRLPAFDALYEKSRTLPHSPPRTALFDEMNDLIFNYAPWIMTNYPYENIVVQPWLKGYKLNTFVQQQWRYLDIEAAALIQVGSGRATAFREIPSPPRRRRQQRLACSRSADARRPRAPSRIRRCGHSTSPPRDRTPAPRRAGRG